jgi:hypothetical protein
MGLEIRVFHDMQTHFIRIKDFTESNDKTSPISSSGRITSDAATLCRGGIFMRESPQIGYCCNLAMGQQAVQVFAF